MLDMGNTLLTTPVCPPPRIASGDPIALTPESFKKSICLDFHGEEIHLHKNL
jgi:hypothetical protein